VVGTASGERRGEEKNDRLHECVVGILRWAGFLSSSGLGSAGMMNLKGARDIE
jgi:hypothetical protein